MLLFGGASSGLRMVVLIADQFAAQGEALYEYEHGRRTREAVQAHADALFARWDKEPQDVQMTLAGLAAVFPQQAAAAGVLPKLAALTERWPGTRRAVALRLAQAAALCDDPATLAEIAAVQAWHWQGPLAVGSPLAPPQTRALHLLHNELLYE